MCKCVRTDACIFFSPMVQPLQPAVRFVPIGTHLAGKSNLGKREPTLSWILGHERDAGRVLSFSFLFVLASVVASGCATLWNSEDYDRGGDEWMRTGFEDGSTATCFRATRRADHAILHLSLGSPTHMLKLLWRPDYVLPADSEETLYIFSERILKSLTTTCTLTSCRDSAMAYVDGSHKLVRVKTQFKYVSTDSADVALNRAHLLGLDGELRMTKGYSYYLSNTHLCWAPTSDLHTESSSGAFADTHGGLALTPDANGMMQTTVADVMVSKLPTPLRERFSSTCQDAVTTSTKVNVFPVDAANEWQVWLVLESLFIYEFSPDILHARREVLELGHDCAEMCSDLQRVQDLYLLDCSLSPYFGCEYEPALPFRRIADHRIRIDVYDSGSAMLYAQPSDALKHLPALMDYDAAIALAFGRLFVMVLTAAVVYVRGSQEASSAVFMLKYMIDVARNTVTKKVLPFSLYNMHLDVAITIAALLSRVLVVSSTVASLLDDGQAIVLVAEFLGITASAFHIFLRHVALDTNLKAEAPITKLGGPMSVVDVSAAVLLAFSDAPLLSIHDGRFAAVGRLLIAILISLTTIPRCCFSAAGCALLGATVTNVRVSDDQNRQLKEAGEKPWHPDRYRNILYAGFFLWFVQAVVCATTLASVFVQPAAYSLTRMVPGDVRVFRYALFFGILAIGLPTFNKTALRCLEHTTSYFDAEASDARRHKAE